MFSQSQTRVPPPGRTLYDDCNALFFAEDQLVLRSWTGAGWEYKSIEPSAAVAAFNRQPVDSGWLPPHHVSWSVTVKGTLAVLFIPAANHANRVKLDNRPRPESLKVPLPSLVFAGLGTRYYIWAVRERQFDPNSAAFQAPLANVTSDGQICFGGNTVPTADVATIVNTWDLFRDSPFNDHDAKERCLSQTEDVRALLVQLDGRRSFPRRELVRAGAPIGSVVNQLFNKE